MNNYGKSQYFERITEKTWQTELYRTICLCLPDDVTVSVEVGGIFCENGILDIYLADYQWAVELLIDGDRLNEHWNRFQPGISTFNSSINSSINYLIAIYISRITIINIFPKHSFNPFNPGGNSTIPIKDFLLIDIRETTDVKNIYKDTWHIIPNEDFKSFTVKMLDKNGKRKTFTIYVEDKKNLICNVNTLFFSIASLTVIIFILRFINLFLLYIIFKK